LCVKGKKKVVPVHTKKAYRGNGGMSLLILEWSVQGLSLLLYHLERTLVPMNRRLCGAS